VTEKEKFDADDLDGRLVPDPASPDVRRLKGFLLGKSDRPDYWRLYLNADLTYYLEFKKEDTVHAKQFHSNETIVWVKPQTRVQVVRTGSVPVEFLRGDIIRQQLGGSAVSGFRRAMGVAAADASGCAHCTPDQSWNCPEHPGTGGAGTGFSCGC
jgi:hypothetical protein